MSKNLNKPVQPRRLPTMPPRWDMLILASFFLVPMAIGVAIAILLPIIQALR
jgi:hypothetical protein